MNRVLSRLFIVLFWGCALNIPGQLAWAGPNEDLIDAATTGNVGGVEEALRAGADVNARDATGETALMEAASWGRANVIPLLLKAGADVNARNKYGATALITAAYFGYANVIPPLLKAGANVDAKDNGGYTALMYAAQFGNADGIPFLRAGANVNTKDTDGVTELMRAANKGHAGVILLLLRAGANVNARDATGETALMRAANNGHVNVIPLLLRAGADVNARDKDGDTALIDAAKWGHANVIPLLLRAGADVNAKNKRGYTAESFANGNSKSEIISLLDDWKIRHSGTAVAKNSTSSSGISRSEAQDIAAQAAKQAVEQANAAINRKLAALSAKPAPPKAPTYHSSVDHPSYSEPRHRKDFALVIGVEQYPRPIHAATFADRDAQAMFAHLRALGVPLRHIKRLTDETATGNRIKGALHWLKRNVQPSSTVYVYFSGHGAPGRSGDAYLVPFDGDPNDLSDTGVSTSAFYRDLEHLPVRHIIVALDACFTGEGKRSVLGKGIRPLVTKIKEGAVPSSGKLVVLTAARSNQESGILDSKGHGLFTYYLLKGLNGQAEHGGHVTVASLYRYLKPKVQSEASLDNRDQTPELEPKTSGHSLSIQLR